MIAFQPPDPGSSKQRQDNKNNNNQSFNNRRGNYNDRSKQTSFSRKNVFQRPETQKRSAVKQTKPFSASPSLEVQRSDPRPAVSSVGSIETLSPNELQLNEYIGGFKNFSGFNKMNHPARPLPKYLIDQPPSLNSGDLLDVDPWDRQNQLLMESKEQSTADLTTLFEEFQELREIERKTMEEKGLVDNENIRRSLEDAIVFKGSCMDMCPVYERIRRSVENDVRKYEKDDSGKISKFKAIKAFSRPAAGQPPPLPSDVRPPPVLVNTLNYIVDNLLTLLPEAQSFIWDRTRSIRQDFTYQNFLGPEAMDCNERIVRVHLITLHIMAKTNSDYSQQQELEQMNKALKTLSEMYTEYRSRGIVSPNEAEFRAYYLLSQLRDPELEREIQVLSADILQDERVQLALEIRNLVSTNIVQKDFQPGENVLNLYQSFFHLFSTGKIPILMSYLLEIHLNEIRFYSVKSIKASIHNTSKPYPLDALQRLLAFNNEADAIEFVEYYGLALKTVNGAKCVDILSLSYNSHLIPDQKRLRQAFSDKFDSKVSSLKQLVNSGKVNTDIIKFESQAYTKPRPGASKQLSSAIATSLQDPSSSSPAFAFSLPTQPEAPKVDEAKVKEQEDLVRRQEALRQQKLQEEMEAQKKIAEAEAKAREEQRKKLEEEQRLENMKRTIREKQEAKRQKKVELINTLGSDLQDKLIKTEVHDEVSLVLKTLIQAKVEAKKKKQKQLNFLTSGLYEAFMNEVLYFEKLKIMSDIFRERQLKKQLLSKITKIARNSKEKLDLKKRKREEFLEVSKNFGIPKIIKRKKVKNDGNTSIISQITSSIPSSQTNSVDLSPLNFDRLLKNVSEQSFKSYDIMLFTNYELISKFLERKFQVLHNETAVDLKIIKLQKIENVNLFQHVNLLVFNIISSKSLNDQKSILTELIEGIKLNNNYQLEILLVYWDLDNHDRNYGYSGRLDIIKELNIIPNDSSISRVSYVKIGSDLNVSELQSTLDSSGTSINLSAKGKFNYRYSKDSSNKLPVVPIKPSFVKPKIKIFDESNKNSQNMIKKFQSHIEASPKFKKLPKLLSDQNVNGIDNLFHPKSSNTKMKIDVYSTPRPKSSELLQTPSFYNDSTSSSISNLSNVTFENKDNKNTPSIIKKPTYAQIASSSIPTSTFNIGDDKNKNKKNFEIKKDVDDEEGVPRSILELRKLAKSVKERHGKK